MVNVNESDGPVDGNVQSVAARWTVDSTRFLTGYGILCHEFNTSLSSSKPVFPSIDRSFVVDAEWSCMNVSVGLGVCTFGMVPQTEFAGCVGAGRRSGGFQWRTEQDNGDLRVSVQMSLITGQ